MRQRWLMALLLALGALQSYCAQATFSSGGQQVLARLLNQMVFVVPTGSSRAPFYGRLTSIYSTSFPLISDGVYIDSVVGREFVPLQEGPHGLSSSAAQVYLASGCDRHEVCVGDAVPLSVTINDDEEGEVRAKIIGRSFVHEDFAIGQVLADSAPFKKGTLVTGITADPQAEIEGARLGSVVKYRVFRRGKSGAMVGERVGIVTSLYDYMDVDGMPQQFLILNENDRIGPLYHIRFTVVPSSVQPLLSATALQGDRSGLKMSYSTLNLDNCPVAWSFTGRRWTGAVQGPPEAVSEMVEAMSEAIPSLRSEPCTSDKNDSDRLLRCRLHAKAGSSINIKGMMAWRQYENGGFYIQICIE